MTRTSLELYSHWAERIVRKVAIRLPESMRERYLEEWLAEVHAIPGGLTRLWYAVSLLLNRRMFLVADSFTESLIRWSAIGFAFLLGLPRRTRLRQYKVAAVVGVLTSLLFQVGVLDHSPFLLHGTKFATSPLAAGGLTILLLIVYWRAIDLVLLLIGWRLGYIQFSQKYRR